MKFLILAQVDRMARPDMEDICGKYSGITQIKKKVIGLSCWTTTFVVNI